MTKKPKTIRSTRFHGLSVSLNGYGDSLDVLSIAEGQRQATELGWSKWTVTAHTSTEEGRPDAMHIAKGDKWCAYVCPYFLDELRRIRIKPTEALEAIFI